MVWVSLLTPYPRPSVLPEVVPLPHAQLEQLARGRPRSILGLYTGGAMVYLLVHYVQQANGKYEDEPDRCLRYNLQELEAYAVQNRYLERTGQGRRAFLQSYCRQS